MRFELFIDNGKVKTRDEESFDPKKHPRGQPKNAGEFSHVGVHVSKTAVGKKGSKTKVDVEATPKAAPPAPPAADPNLFTAPMESKLAGLQFKPGMKIETNAGAEYLVTKSSPDGFTAEYGPSKAEMRFSLDDLKAGIFSGVTKIDGKPIEGIPRAYAAARRASKPAEATAKAQGVPGYGNEIPAAHAELAGTKPSKLVTKEDLKKIVDLEKVPLEVTKKVIDKFAGKNYFFFHGTSVEAAASIMKYGLIPKGGPGGDEWALKHGLANQKDLKDLHAGDRKMSVFMTQNISRAAQYSRISSEMTGTDPVILAVTVPPEQQANIVPDELDYSSGSLRFVGEIKPEWIAPAIIPVPPGSTGMTFKPNPATHDAAAPTFYIVVLAQPAPAPTPPPPDSKKTKDAFDPKEPRGQPENAGEWAKSPERAGHAELKPGNAPVGSETGPIPQHPSLEKLKSDREAAGTILKGNTLVQGPPGTTVETKTVHHPHVVVQKNEIEPDNQPAQLSWEATPGRTAENQMPQIHDAPMEQRREFHDAIEKVLTDDKGHDLIAQAFGLDVMPSFKGPGAFEGRVGPGEQGQVNLPDAALYKPLSDDDIMKLNACEATRGMLLRQDAAAWHRPRFLPQRGQPYLIPTLKFNGKLYADGPTHRNAFAKMPEQDRKDFVTSGEVRNTRAFLYTDEKGRILNRTQARAYAEEQGMLNARGQQFQQPELVAEHLDPKFSVPQQRLKPQDANMLDFRVGRTLTDDESLAVMKALSHLGGGFYSPIASKQGFRLLNVPEITGLDNVAFADQVEQALNGMQSDTLSDIVMHTAASDSGYIDNNWKENPHGENYKATIAGYNRPDVARTSDQLLAALGPKVAAVEDDFAKRYGWTPDLNTRFWEQNTTAPKVTREVVNATPGQPLHIVDCRYIMRDSFNPDESRKSSGPGGGEWTKGGASAASPSPAVRSLPVGQKEQLAALQKSLLKDDPDRPASNLFEAATRNHQSSSAEDIIAAAGYAAKLKIDIAKARTASGIPTDALADSGGFKMREGNYTPEREALHEKIIRSFLNKEAVERATPLPGKKPQAVFFGGRGGSGKSWLMKDGHVVDPKNFIYVNPDDIQEHLPGYQGWNAGLFHEEASDIAARINQLCQKLGLNVIHDVTMRSQGKLEEEIKRHIDKGYECNGYYMFASPETAAKRAVGRFITEGRFVPPDYVLSSTSNEKTFDSVKKYFSKWAVYNNDSPEFNPKLASSGGQSVAA